MSFRQGRLAGLLTIVAAALMAPAAHGFDAAREASNYSKITERFRRPNFGSLEIDITIDDPKAYTKPFTVRVNQRIMPDTELIEFICDERDAKHYVGAAPK